MSTIHITTANGREHILAPDEAREIYEKLRAIFEASRLAGIPYPTYHPSWDMGPITCTPNNVVPFTTKPTNPQG